MPVVTVCSSCSTRLQIPDTLIGTARAVRCPRCGTAVPVPQPVSPHPPAPAVVAPSPPASFACPHCRAEVACDSRLAGRTVACPRCQGQFQMPGAAAAVQSYPPPPAAAPAPAVVTPRRAAVAPPSRRIWLYAGVGGGTVLLLLVVLLVVLLRSSGSGLGDEQKYFPDDARLVASIDLRGILNSPVGRKLRASKVVRQLEQEFAGKNGGDDLNKAFEKAVGLPLEDVRRVTVAGRFGDRDLMVVIKANNASRFRIGGMGGPPPEFRAEAVGRYTLNESRGTAYCIPDNGTILIAPVQVLRQVLTRDRAPELSAGLRDALGQADFSQALTVAVSLRDLKGQEKDQFDREFARGLPPELANARDALDGVVAQFRADSHLDLHFALLCNDPRKADDIKDALNRALNDFRQQARQAPDAPAELFKILDALQFSSNGGRVNLDVRIDVDDLLRAIDNAMAQPRPRREPGDKKW